MKRTYFETLGKVNQAKVKATAEGCHEHHTALSRGYYCRPNSKYYPGGEVWTRPYAGKFGEGYVIEYPCMKSNSYHYICYMVK